MAQNKPNCFKCIHLFITFSPGKPYGCRAMRFKSKKIPSKVVYESSGIFCQLFSPKDTEDDSKNNDKKKWVA